MKGALLHKAALPNWWAERMTQDKKARSKYRTINWPQYNAALKARGSPTMWLDRGMQGFGAPRSKRGRSQTFFAFARCQRPKARQHSSADKEALRSILKVYEEVIERLDLTDELLDDLKKNAEIVWEKFMNGEDLTADDDVQAIIDR